MPVVCFDTEYDARYSDRGVARLACMTYSLGPDHAVIVGPEKATELWRDWIYDDDIQLLAHGGYNDMAVLADETYFRVEGKRCVPGTEWAWESAHRVYESGRMIDSEIRHRLTQIRFGPHKADVKLSSIVKRLFDVDVSDSKTVPDEAQALLRAAVPYEEWPADVMAKTPHRVLFGYYLERYGEDPNDWPADAVAYALDDVRWPWKVVDWQRERWGGRVIPDERRQTRSSWDLLVLSIPGWLADRERAASIRKRYRHVVAHCDRTLASCGILHIAPPKCVTKRAKVQAHVVQALGDAAPLTKTTLDRIDDPSAVTDEERLEGCATDEKTLREAIAANGSPELAALLEWKALRKRGATPEEVSAPQQVLESAGIVEVVNARTIKTAVVAQHVYAVLGDAAPMTDTGQATCPNPTPRERLKYCATDAKTVRAAILAAGATPLNVVDAVDHGEDREAFDAWLKKSGQAELNAFAVRSKADKTISNFLDNFDTDRRIRTTYQTLVDTGRTSCLAGWVPVRTRRGAVPIADIRPGDLVWTHNKRWRKVLHTWTKGVQPMYRLRLSNGQFLVCTGSHRVLLYSGRWCPVEEILHVNRTSLGECEEQSQESCKAVPGSGAVHNERDCQDAGYDAAQCAARGENRHTCAGVQSAQDSALLDVKARQEESHARQDARAASSLESGLRDGVWLPFNPAQRSPTDGAPRCDGGSAGAGRTAGGFRSTPHRRRSQKQRTGQPSDGHDSRSRHYPCLAGTGLQGVEVEEANYCGDHEVFDITVDEDESYEACGIFHHNSRKINVQQLPRDYDKPKHLHVRGCIVPDPGWAFIIADYTQLELCALAHVLNMLVRHYARGDQRALAENLIGREISTSYESTLAQAINAGQDCHVLMAAVLRGNGETYEECYSLYERADAKKSAKEPLTSDEAQVIEDRQLAKPADFGFPGGLGERKFIDYAAGYGITITLPIAKRAKAAFMQAWPEMKLYFHHVGKLTANGSARIVQLYSKRERGNCYFTRACNTYFQGLAADGAKEALTMLIDHAYRRPGSPMYGTRPSGFVHDEFLVSSRVEQAERALPEVERLMIEGMRRWIPDVKIKAPGKVLYERWSK